MVLILLMLLILLMADRTMWCMPRQIVHIPLVQMMKVLLDEWALLTPTRTTLTALCLYYCKIQCHVWLIGGGIYVDDVGSNDVGSGTTGSVNLRITWSVTTDPVIRKPFCGVIPAIHSQNPYLQNKQQKTKMTDEQLQEKKTTHNNTKQQKHIVF